MNKYIYQILESALFGDIINADKDPDVDNVAIDVLNDISAQYDWIPEFIYNNFNSQEGQREIVKKINPNMLNNIRYRCFNALEKFDTSSYSSDKGLIKMIQFLCNIFGECNISLNWIDVSGLVNLSGLFKGISGYVCVDISDWDVSSVVNAKEMFKDSFIEVAAEDLDFSSLETAENMFKNAKMVPKCVETWKFKKLKNMEGCFSGCLSIDADISKWNTKTVKNMKKCFVNVDFNVNDYAQEGLRNLEVKNVQDFSEMFSGSSGCFDLSEWDVKNAKFMTHMFYNSNVADANIASWEMPKLQDITDMFAFTSYYEDISSWAEKLPQRVTGQKSGLQILDFLRKKNDLGY